MNENTSYGFTMEEWNTCIKVLSLLKDNPFQNPNNELFSGLVTKINKQAKKIKRSVSYKEKKESDLLLLQKSIINKNAQLNVTLFGEQEGREKAPYSKLNVPKNCYSCNSSFSEVHFFYSRLCPVCAENNYKMRFQKINLEGRKVIVTGGRVKVGFAAALKFLRSNAEVTVTTRFPRLAYEVFSKEDDFKIWKDRLNIYGLDLRDLKSVRRFIDYYKSENEKLDILVNNAAQTIKYDRDYYRPLIKKEKSVQLPLSFKKKVTKNKTPVFDENVYLQIGRFNLTLNRFGQPVDKRLKNSWNSRLEEISMVELLEVNLINQISPYYLIREFAINNLPFLLVLFPLYFVKNTRHSPAMPAFFALSKEKITSQNLVDYFLQTP